MPKQDSTADGLIPFIAGAPTAYHAAASVLDRLLREGFTKLSADKRFMIEAGGRYVLPLGDGALMALALGDQALAESGLTILAAHTDSPALRLKERGTGWRKGYLTVPTELYGGPIIATWIDRALGIAGRAVTRDGRSHLYRLPQRAVIPNLPIHLNRTANENLSYNAQTHLMAVIGTAAGEKDRTDPSLLASGVADALGVAEDNLYEFEALLFDPEDGVRAGRDGSLLVAPRIDNLAGCYANLEAFLATPVSRPRLLVMFNHEEIGSLSGEGARAGAVEGFVRRIVSSLGGDGEDASVALARSLLLSNDAAHAFHPGYADKFDADYAPALGSGPVLKSDGMYRYATTAETGARFRAACEDAGVPMQRYVTRSDIRSGSTVGPISWAVTGIPTVDVGVAILAMHSIRETASLDDVSSMIESLSSLVR
jgi:aspartyl aminopeptidase